jgi:hypothetical protein
MPSRGAFQLFPQLPAEFSQALLLLWTKHAQEFNDGGGMLGEDIPQQYCPEDDF